jgi:hypothetical protein
LKFQYSSVKEAEKLEEKFKNEGNIEQQFLARLKVQAGSPDLAIPKPWDLDQFDFKPLGLREMFAQLSS